MANKVSSGYTRTPLLDPDGNVTRYWARRFDNFETKLFPLPTAPLPVFANNAAAKAGGLAAGKFYRTGADPDQVCVVH